MGSMMNQRYKERHKEMSDKIDASSEQIESNKSRVACRLSENEMDSMQTSVEGLAKSPSLVPIQNSVRRRVA